MMPIILCVLAVPCLAGATPNTPLKRQVKVLLPTVIANVCSTLLHRARVVPQSALISLSYCTVHCEPVDTITSSGALRYMLGGIADSWSSTSLVHTVLTFGHVNIRGQKIILNIYIGNTTGVGGRRRGWGGWIEWWRTSLIQIRSTFLFLVGLIAACVDPTYG
jgi:hypothetical protein